MEHPQPRRGESSKPIRYNPVPIGGPDRPPLTLTHSPAGTSGAAFASSPGRSHSNASRRNGAPKTGLGSPVVKREPDFREGSEYQSEPPSARTDRSSTVYAESNGNGVKSEDGDDERQKKRQKRNKPTLSCKECVERKTKVGRGLSSLLKTPFQAGYMLPFMSTPPYIFFFCGQSIDVPVFSWLLCPMGGIRYFGIR